jgi:CubicO group peptidase (beta-lactamase class C family)
MPTTDPEAAGFSPVRLERLTRFLQGFIDRGDLPCASLFISRDGIPVYREKFGWQDIETQKSLEYDTLFRIMSMTKPVTAAAAMLLYEEGHFTLNTPISQFLPEFKDVKVAKSWKEDGVAVLEDLAGPITIRHLFTHTSGLSYGFMPDTDPLDKLYAALQKPYFKGKQPEGLRPFAAELASLPLAFQPGTQWRYGMNQDMLAVLIEVISGMPFADFLQARLFTPLKMPDTMFRIPAEKRPRLATLYYRSTQAQKLARQPESDLWMDSPLPMPMWGGGGLTSTLDDYARFAAMLVNGGELDGVRVLSPTTASMFSVNQAHEEALPSWVADDPVNRSGYGYSLGTAVLLDPAANGKFGHTGEFYWGGAFSTVFFIDPSDALYAVFMTHYNPVVPLVFFEPLKQMIYAAVVR